MKTNALLNLINNELDIYKIHLYAKDPSEAKYQLLINKRESTGLKYLYDCKAFMIWMIFIKILKNTIQTKNKKILMVFDAIIADMLCNKKRNAIVTELFIRGRKLNVSVFYYTILFCCSKKY